MLEEEEKEKEMEEKWVQQQKMLIPGEVTYICILVEYQPSNKDILNHFSFPSHFPVLYVADLMWQKCQFALAVSLFCGPYCLAHHFN